MGQEASSNDAIPSFAGQMSVPPRGPLLTAILAITGVLLAIEAASLIGRHVLGFQRPTEVKLTPSGIDVHGRTLMLGRLLREHSTVIPREGLVRVTRDVRYPSLAMYAGLIALAIGSYLGVGLVVDGVRAASPSMLGTGLVIALLGLGLDFAFSSLVPGLAGRTRVVLVPRRGGVLCISWSIRGRPTIAEQARPVDAARVSSPLGPRRKRSSDRCAPGPCREPGCW